MVQQSDQIHCMCTHGDQNQSNTSNKQCPCSSPKRVTTSQQREGRKVCMCLSARLCVNRFSPKPWLLWISDVEICTSKASWCSRMCEGFPFLGTLRADCSRMMLHVDKRITQASRAFGSLRRCVFADRDKGRLKSFHHR